MRKPEFLKVVLCAPVVICSCSCALNKTKSGYSMAQATVTQPFVRPRVTDTSVHEPLLPGQKASLRPHDLASGSSGSIPAAATDFSQRIRGGTLIRYESGLIVVRPSTPPASLQPTGFTTDAIITSSVRSKMAGQPQLRTRRFDVQTNDGVVTIHANEESLEEAAEVINLTLGVPDVRQIVYTMPTTV